MVPSRPSPGGIVRRRAYQLLGHAVRRLYAVVYPLAVAYWRVRHPRTTSVLIVVCCRDQILLVRHPYGRREWMPPGGGVRRGEALDAAARREVREEVGIEVPTLVRHGAVESRFEGRHDTTWVFSTEVAKQDFHADSWEIAEARWFAIPAIRASDAPMYRGLARCLKMVRRA